jgi:hypothetical protein
MEERFALHRAFWSGSDQGRPLASFRIGDFFFARHCRAAASLLVPERETVSGDLAVADYMDDYERMFAEAESCGQDAFWTAEPYTGIPWMEAILGCEVRAGKEAFTTRPAYASAAMAADAMERVVSGMRSNPSSNPWLAKYLEFTKALVQLGRGRFTVGQPIMRGPSDMVGALLGQTGMVYSLIDDPGSMERLVSAVTKAFLTVIKLQRELVPAFHGGTALGFYHVWAPGTSIWFQDDLSAILSPSMYGEFFLGAARDICRGYEYTAVHLHHSSFFILDQLLELPELRAVEVNKDIGGPSVPEMVGILERILEKKRLILWGDITLDDLAFLKSRIPPRGVFLNIVAPSAEEAHARNKYVQEWSE